MRDAQFLQTMARAAPGTRARPQSPAWSAYAACAWSLAYAALGLYWAFGGGGFPYGKTDEDVGVSMLTGLRADTTGALIAVLGVLGAAVALAMVRPWGRAVPCPVLLGFGGVVAAILLLVVPDIRALTFLGYLPALLFGYGFSSVDWPVVLNQGICLVGGIAWVAATLTYARATGEPTTRAATRGEPGWGRWVTYVAAVLPLPYAATRLAWAMGIPLGVSDAFLREFEASGATVAELSLAGMAIVGSVLTLGLAQRWGEVFPDGLPGLGGKRVPPLLAIVPASIAAILLTIGGLALWRVWLTGGTSLLEEGWGTVTPALVFLPWGIALGLATYAYAERRRNEADAESR